MVALIDLQGGTKKVECGPVYIILLYLFKGKMENKQTKKRPKHNPLHKRSEVA